MGCPVREQMAKATLPDLHAAQVARQRDDAQSGNGASLEGVVIVAAQSGLIADALDLAVSGREFPAGFISARTHC